MIGWIMVGQFLRLALSPGAPYGPRRTTVVRFRGKAPWLLVMHQNLSRPARLSLISKKLFTSLRSSPVRAQGSRDRYSFFFVLEKEQDLACSNAGSQPHKKDYIVYNVHPRWSTITVATNEQTKQIPYPQQAISCKEPKYRTKKSGNNPLLK